MLGCYSESLFLADAPVGYNYGLPLSHLILAKQLESCTSLRSDSSLFDEGRRRRQRIFDICLATVGPTVGYLVSLSCRQTRFNVVENYGPLPGIYWDTWGIVWVAVSWIGVYGPADILENVGCYRTPIHESAKLISQVVPIFIAMLCFGYTAQACYNILRRRQQMRTILSKNAAIDRNHFWRLMILANAELGTCMCAHRRLLAFSG